MPTVAVFAKLVAKTDQRAAVQTALEKLVASTKSEDGTLLYGLHQESSNADVFWFYELYADNDALGAHSGSDAMAEALGTLGNSLAEAPMLIVTNPLQAKGLPI